MTPEDKQFVREQYTGVWRTGHNPPDKQRLIFLLIEAEAMRDKAEFYKDHHQDKSYCVECSALDRDSRHDLEDSDWIEAKRKELVG